MRRSFRDTLVSVRELLITAGPFLLITAALLGAAYYFLKPTPPKRVVLATGSDQGAYAAFGKRYQEELKRFGIEVILRPTAGSRENLRLLQDAKQDVQIAFVQGGASGTLATTDENVEEKLPVMSLGSIFYEPVWLFYRTDAAKKVDRKGVFTDLTQLRGLRVNVGARGSGSPGIVNRMLLANRMDRTDITRDNLDLTPAVVELLAGKLDAMVMVSAPESPLVQMLLQTPGIRLLEFDQAEAYARRYRYLSPVTLPRGVVDLPRNVPPQDLDMVATTCSLVAREDLHPALVQLFVQAASRIHSGGGWISKTGQFPTQLHTEFPLARDAERYYRTGPPAMQRYLPFWLANLVDRMWVALFSIIAILIPLARVVPPLYTYRIRSRIYKWYRDLRQIEDDLGRKDANAAALLVELEKLDAKVERIAVPLAYADELYALRSAIGLVRKRLRLATQP
ncbi:MAG: TAXI family TRAP transporter solute-binding subunit [Betaproteobacteria bacterium]